MAAERLRRWMETRPRPRRTKRLKTPTVVTE